MNNLEFSKTIFTNELQGTINIIKAMPEDQLTYTPHVINRTAYEIAEHIAAHVHDFKIILQEEVCDEKLSFPFSSPDDLANKVKIMWEDTLSIMETYDDEKWTSEHVELLVAGKLFGAMPRFQMMWFFLNDIIHHRGQLSSYIRPMGGKNPTIYGWSADTV